MKEKSFLDNMRSSVANSATAIFMVVTGLCSLVAYFVVPDTEISLKYLLAALFIMFALISITFNAANMIFDDHQKKPNSLLLRPKVIKAKDPTKYYDRAIGVLITEPTENLPNDSIVSIYFLVSGFEELIALGRVINIQDDKKVQVLITYDHDFEKHRNDIMKNDREALQKIVLKSAIPSLIVSGVFNFG